MSDSQQQVNLPAIRRRIRNAEMLASLEQSPKAQRTSRDNGFATGQSTMQKDPTTDAVLAYRSLAKYQGYQEVQKDRRANHRQENPIDQDRVDQIINIYSPPPNRTKKQRVFDQPKHSLASLKRSGSNLIAHTQQAPSPTSGMVSLLSHSRRLAALGEASSPRRGGVAFPAIPSVGSP